MSVEIKGVQQKYFFQWMGKKLEEYLKHFPDAYDNPSKNPRKGVTPGELYPFSLVKYAASMMSILVGNSTLGEKVIPLEDMAKALNSIGPTSANQIRVWRNNDRFKKTVLKLGEEYVTHYHALLYETEELGLAERLELWKEMFWYYPADLFAAVTIQKAAKRKTKRSEMGELMDNIITLERVLVDPTISLNGKTLPPDIVDIYVETTHRKLLELVASDELSEKDRKALVEFLHSIFMRSVDK